MMKSLEQEVGFPLFNKGHHGVSITKEGKALLPAIRNLLSANESLNQEISFLKGSQERYLDHRNLYQWFHTLDSRDHPGVPERFPGICFEISEGHEGDLIDWVENHKVDIGFISYHEHQPYEFIPVCDDPMMAVVPKGHPLPNMTKYPSSGLKMRLSSALSIPTATMSTESWKTAGIKPDIKYTTSTDSRSCP